MVWEIWNHKNIISFRQGKVDEEEIISMTQLKGWVWLK